MPIVATDYKSIVGPVKWTGQPVKNVTKTPLVAGQWQRKGDKFELVITTNKTGAGDSGRRASWSCCRDRNCQPSWRGLVPAHPRLDAVQCP